MDGEWRQAVTLPAAVLAQLVQVVFFLPVSWRFVRRLFFYSFLAIAAVNITL